MNDPLETNAVNIDGTLNVLVAARDTKVKRFVYAASSSAYGESPSLPKHEKMQPEPISPYGVTKYVGELFAQAFGRVYPPRAGDIRDSQADISLARKLLGYEPRVSFEEGLRSTWDWYKSAYGKK